MSDEANLDGGDGFMSRDDADQDLAALRAIGSTLTSEDFERHAPPDRVWTGIKIGVRDEIIQREHAAVVDLTERSARRAASLRNPRVLAAAAVAAVIVAVSALALATVEPDPVVVNEVVLNDLDLPVATDETADARLLQDGDGWLLEVDFSGLPETAGEMLELWVIDPGVTNPVSLGFIDGDGRFALPADIDPTDFPIVDISVEPDDGNPLHSGQSVLRGVLDI